MRNDEGLQNYQSKLLSAYIVSSLLIKDTDRLEKPNTVKDLSPTADHLK
jgi:hypothetical protein